MFLLSFSVITNPKVPAGTKDAVKNFSFDFSYWSHDVSNIILLLSFVFNTIVITITGGFVFYLVVSK
jgi:hypothetical protein